MQYVHPLVLAELLNDDETEVRVPRPALAGGSDRRPPEDGPSSAQVIRFPVERVRRREVPEDRSGDIDRHPKPQADERSEADAARSDSLWPAWMLKTLTGRYHARVPSQGSQTGLTV